jgi:hypothetical protein
MWNDNETSVDFIDFSHYVDAVYQIIESEDLLPCSIGIYGDWGSGKSSLMKMIGTCYDNQKDKGVLVVRFNGWLFEGFEDTKTVLISRMIEELTEQLPLEAESKNLATKLLKKVNWLKIGATVIKHGAAAVVSGGASLLTTDYKELAKNIEDSEPEGFVKDDETATMSKNIQNFHKDFEKLLDSADVKKVIVLIDDLDRCHFLFSPKTAFIIGADERLIKYAVQQRFPKLPGENAEVGRDYLEKLIQFPVRIPSLNSMELYTYMNLLFSKLYLEKAEFEVLRKKVVEKEATKKWRQESNSSMRKDLLKDLPNNDNEPLKDALLLSEQIAQILTISLNGNPRQTKRFLNTLLMRSKMAESKGIALQKRILSKLMLLEYFLPETFKVCNTIQAMNEGIIADFAVLESDEKIKRVSLELEPIKEDRWFQDWLKIEPLLKNIDLSPYFYFSRDKLSVVHTKVQRMSPNGQEVYGKLLSDKAIINQEGLREAKSLNQADVAAIFEALTEKSRHYEGKLEMKSPLKKLIDLSMSRKELLAPQLIQFLNGLPTNILSVWVVPILENELMVSHGDILQPLLNKWGKSDNKPLVNAIKPQSKK